MRVNTGGPCFLLCSYLFCFVNCWVKVRMCHWTACLIFFLFESTILVSFQKEGMLISVKATDHIKDNKWHVCLVCFPLCCHSFYFVTLSVSLCPCLDCHHCECVHTSLQTDYIYVHLWRVCVCIHVWEYAHLDLAVFGMLMFQLNNDTS